MTWHLFVHYLDDLRREGITTFAWENVKTNIGAGPYWAVIASGFSYIFVPRFRNWVNGHFRRAQESRNANHEEMKALAVAHHEEHLALARKHHEELKKAVNGGVALKKPAAKK